MFELKKVKLPYKNKKILIDITKIQSRDKQYW